MFTRSSLSVKLEIDLAPSVKNPSSSSCRHGITIGGELNKENTWTGILEGVWAEASALLVKHCRIVNMKRALFKCWSWNFAAVDAMDTASSCWSVGLSQSGYTLILCHPFSADFKHSSPTPCHLCKNKYLSYHQIKHRREQKNFSCSSIFHIEN